MERSSAGEAAIDIKSTETEAASRAGDMPEIEAVAAREATPPARAWRAANVGVVVAVAVALVKLATVVVTGSAAMLASAVDSFADVAAAVLIWSNLRASRSAPQSVQRIQSARSEAIPALVQAAFVGGAGLVTLSITIRRMLFPVVIEHVVTGLIVMVVSIIATLGLMLYQRRTLALGAAAERIHYESDLLTNVAVVLSLVGAGIYGLNILDAVVGAVVALYLLVMAARMGRDAMRAMVERPLPADLQERIERTALAEPEVVAFNGLRTRDDGVGQTVECHIEVRANLTVAEAHRLVLELEDAVEDLLEGPEVAVIALPAQPGPER